MQRMTAPSFKEKALQFREDAIVEAVNQLLATKGYELMTVDEVAALAGVAKASLYKHFSSKEDLAAAAMVRVLDRAMAHADTLLADTAANAFERLRAVVRWTLQVQLSGQMPTLPAQNSKLVAALRANRDYMDRLMTLSDTLGAWITEGQSTGHINSDMPPELVLYTLYARACDPVLGLLKASGAYSDVKIVEWLVTATLSGVASQPKRSGKLAIVKR